MSTTPDPKKVREIARSAFGYLPHDYVRARLVQAAIAEHGIDEHDVPTWSAYFDAAKADLAGAVVSWPDEQPQEFECEVCTKPITAYPCILCEHEPDPWAAHRCDNCEGVDPVSCVNYPGAKHPQDERDAQLADLATELDAANDNADDIADRASAYREEIMRLRARVRELEGAQDERDGAAQAAAEAVSILEGMLNKNAWAYEAGRARNVLLDHFARDLDSLEVRGAKAGE